MRVKGKMSVIFRVIDEMEVIKDLPTSKDKIAIFKIAHKILSDFNKSDSSKDQNLIRVEKLICRLKPIHSHLDELAQLASYQLEKALKPLL